MSDESPDAALPADPPSYALIRTWPFYSGHVLLFCLVTSPGKLYETFNGVICMKNLFMGKGPSHAYTFVVATMSEMGEALWTLIEK